jgi:hypothetical protein
MQQKNFWGRFCRLAGAAYFGDYGCTSGTSLKLSGCLNGNSGETAGISEFDLGRNPSSAERKTIPAATDLDQKPAKCFF